METTGTPTPKPHSRMDHRGDHRRLGGRRIWHRCSRRFSSVVGFPASVFLGLLLDLTQACQVVECFVAKESEIL